VAIPLGGMTTAEMSDLFPVLVVPADHAFSIWSAIYLLLLGFTVWQALPRNREDAALRRLGYLPAPCGAGNAAWVLQPWPPMRLTLRRSRPESNDPRAPTAWVVSSMWSSATIRQAGCVLRRP